MSDILQIIEFTAEKLATISNSCAGPNGKLKAISVGNDHTKEIILTSSSVCLMAYSDVLIESLSTSSSHRAVAHIMIELTKRHSQQHGDGGLLAMQFSTNLIKASIVSDVHHFYLTASFGLAMQWSTEWFQLGMRTLTEDHRSAEVSLVSSSVMSLKTTKTPTSTLVMKCFDLKSTTDGIRLIHSILFSKPLISGQFQRQKQKTMLSNLILQSVLETLVLDDQRNSNVRYVCVLGPRSINTDMVNGLVLVNLPEPLKIPYQSIKSKSSDENEEEDGKIILVAVFDVPLQPPPTSTFLSPGILIQLNQPQNQSVLLSSSSCSNCHQQLVNESFEYKLMDLFLEKVQLLKIGMICTQKTIHPYLRNHLEANGVYVLPRLSAIHIADVQQVTGAVVFSDIWNTFISSSTSTSCSSYSSPTDDLIYKLGIIPTPTFRHFENGQSGIVFRFIKQFEENNMFLFWAQRFLINFDNNKHIEYLKKKLNKLKNQLEEERQEEEEEEVVELKCQEDSVSIANYWLKLVNERRKPICTLIICGIDKHVLKESKSVIETAVITVTNCLINSSSTSFLLQSKGVWEAYLIQELERRICLLEDDVFDTTKNLSFQSQNNTNIIDKTYEKRIFKKGLQLFVSSLSSTAQHRCGDKAWRSALRHASTWTIPAWDTLESFSASSSALGGAVEAANCVVRIQSVSG